MSEDRLEILPVPKGVQAEPEEAPARRVLPPLPVQVNLSGASGELPDVVQMAGRPAIRFKGATPVTRGLMPVSVDMTAGEAAGLLRERCFRCLHFRHEDWQKTMAIWSRAPLGSTRRGAFAWYARNNAVALFGEAFTQAELDAAVKDLREWGWCAALTEARADPVLVHPATHCPDDEPNRYQDRSRTEKREASEIYDTILRKAQGRSA